MDRHRGRAHATRQNVQAHAHAGRVEPDLSQNARLGELQNAMAVLALDLDENHEPLEHIHPIPVLTEQTRLGKIRRRALPRYRTEDASVHELGSGVQRRDLPGEKTASLAETRDLLPILGSKARDDVQVGIALGRQVEGRRVEDDPTVEIPSRANTFADLLTERAPPRAGCTRKLDRSHGRHRIPQPASVTRTNSPGDANGVDDPGALQ